MKFGKSSAVLKASWVISALFVKVSAIFLLPFGRLADIYGRRRVYLLGTILYHFFFYLGFDPWCFSMPMYYYLNIQGLNLIQS